MKGQRGAQEKGDPAYVYNSENMNHPKLSVEKAGKKNSKKSKSKKY